MKLKSLVVGHVKRFVAIDLPLLRERWYQSIDNDAKTGYLSKSTIEARKAYMDALKISMEVIPKMNISVQLNEEEAVVQNETDLEKEINKETVDEKLNRILTKRASIILALKGKKMAT